jgi:hypothetical protein
MDCSRTQARSADLSGGTGDVMKLRVPLIARGYRFIFAHHLHYDHNKRRPYVYFLKPQAPPDPVRP